MSEAKDRRFVPGSSGHLQADRQTAQAAAVGTLILLFVTPVIFVLRRHLLSRQGES